MTLAECLQLELMMKVLRKEMLRSQYRAWLHSPALGREAGFSKFFLEAMRLVSSLPGILIQCLSPDEFDEIHSAFS